MRPTEPLTAFVNGRQVVLPTDNRRLAAYLRDQLGLTGTKIGCNQGDCGSCSVIVDGEIICSCLMPVGQAAGTHIVTIEGVGACTRSGNAVKESFVAHQAIQCGFCTPAFVVASSSLIDRKSEVSDAEVEAALSGILCRCTGYKKIMQAVKAAVTGEAMPAALRPPATGAVGVPIARLDGAKKVDGSEHFGADGAPEESLLIRVVRSPHHHATFLFGDLDEYRARHPGIVAIFTAADLPGRNIHKTSGVFADQPVFAEDRVRQRGEAIAAVVGDRRVIEALDLADFPVEWTPLAAQLDVYSSLHQGATSLHPERPDNVLVRGNVERGDVESAFAEAAHIVEGAFSTQFVEHAYLEPEAGWATREGNRIVIHSCTQAPHAHRDDIAFLLGIDKEDVWIVPTAVGGGFGGKLDLTTQPFLALAAWRLNRPVAIVYTRQESIATSTKRHPTEIRSRIAADAKGMVTGIDFEADFNTGAFASFGPAVATRVPVHASGPYYVPNYRARTRAVHTHVTPAGAFRGFGVPQATIAQEQLIDAMARKLGMDQIDFRILNAIKPGQSLVTGQVLPNSVGITACLEALRPRWKTACADAAAFNRAAGRSRRGAGLAAMFYGCGNTALANPSTIRLGVRPDGAVVLHQGAVDAGQGSNTVIPQIAADALGIAVHDLSIVGASTHLTPDCGRTSASRQTFVTGKAAERAGNVLRQQILALSNAPPDAVLRFGDGRIVIEDTIDIRNLDLSDLPQNMFGYVFMAEETFDPDTTALDQKGQGRPYEIYAFGAQIAEVEVDLDLGTTVVRRMTAAHDVGRMVNPTLLEGQIEGAIAQGIGQALFEEFVPGKTETLHDYLVPTLRDVPPIEAIFVEEHAPAGPFGAKGIGEPSLVPTAASIFNAINDAIGVRIHSVPATPDKVLRALNAIPRTEGRRPAAE